MRLHRTLPRWHMIYMAFMRRVCYRLRVHDFRFWALFGRVAALDLRQFRKGKRTSTLPERNVRAYALALDSNFAYLTDTAGAL